MSCYSKITTWLGNNTNLPWNANNGDDPTKIGWDAKLLNKNEAYEVRDLIAKFFNDCNIGCTDENIIHTYNAIMGYNKSRKRADYITHLKTLIQ